MSNTYQNTLNVAVGLSRSNINQQNRHSQQNLQDKHITKPQQDAAVQQSASAKRVLLSSKQGAAGATQAHLASSMILKVLPQTAASSLTSAEQSVSPAHPPGEHPPGEAKNDSSSQLPQICPRPISNKRASLKTSLPVTTHLEIKFNPNNPAMQASVARNFPSKVCNTTSTNESGGQQAFLFCGAAGYSASPGSGSVGSKQALVEAQSDNDHQNQLLYLRNNDEAANEELLAAYADTLQETEPGNRQQQIYQIQLSAASHHSRSQIATQLSSQCKVQTHQKHNAMQSVRTTSFNEHCAQLSPSDQQKAILFQQSTRSNLDTISKAPDTGPYSVLDGGPGGGLKVHNMLGAAQNANQFRHLVPSQESERMGGQREINSRTLHHQAQVSASTYDKRQAPRRNLENKVQRSNERVAYLKQHAVATGDSIIPSSTTSNKGVGSTVQSSTQQQQIAVMLSRTNTTRQGEHTESGIQSQLGEKRRSKNAAESNMIQSSTAFGHRGAFKEHRVSHTTSTEESTINEFVDRSKMLSAQIGAQRLNLNKNLRRFQDLALEKVQQYPRLTAVANRLLQATPVPITTWTQQSCNNSISNDIVEMKFSPPHRNEESGAASEFMFQLNEQTLDLKLNFNPLMVTFCLLLRALSDQVSSAVDDTAGEQTVIADCLHLEPTLITRLHHIHIRAVQHALQSLNDQEGTIEATMPAKVIEFIKRWVAKEKMLIVGCVKQITALASEAGSRQPSLERSVSLSLTDDLYEQRQSLAVAQDEDKKRAKDLVAKKNKQKLESKVLKSRKQDGPSLHFSNLNSSKESDDFISTHKNCTPKQANQLQIASFSQNNFYKVKSPDSRQLEQHEKYTSDGPSQSNIIGQKDLLVQTTKSLQSKVNNGRHHEIRHRNMRVEYNQVGNDQKQMVFKEPQMALSSTNFNKNHSNSLIQIKIQQNQHGDGINSATIVRQGRPSGAGIGNSEVYGDWKQYRHPYDKANYHVSTDSSHHIKPENKAAKEKMHTDFSHRSLSPTNLQQCQNNQNLPQPSPQRPADHREMNKSSHESLSSALANNKVGISGARTVTSGFFNAQKSSQQLQVSSTNLRKVSNQCNAAAGDLGYQNLSNFQWPRNAANEGKTGSSLVRPQTRDTFFEGQGSAG